MIRAMRAAFFVTVGGILVCAAPGCQAPPKPEGPTQTLMRIPDRDSFIDDVLTLLRELDFPPDEVDRQAAWIVTRPSTSGQWFEIWRRDVHGGYQVLESSLHTVRRRVRVDVQPSGSGEQSADEQTYRLRVTVHKERFSSPERQVTTASGALSIYSERLPTKEGLRKGRMRGDHWVPLGRDPLLERYLLRRFVNLLPPPGQVSEPTEVIATHQPRPGNPDGH